MVSTDVSPPGPLGRMARFAFRHRGLVVLGWLAALLLTIGLSSAFRGEFNVDYAAAGSDSKAAQQLLEERFPAQSGAIVTVVVHADGGAAGVRTEVGQLLGELRTVPHVVSAEDPYVTPGGLSEDGKTAVARLRLDVVNPGEMPVEDSTKLIDIAEQRSADGLDVALGGQAIFMAEGGAVGSEGLGIAAAAIILLLTFGSVVAAGLPIAVAIFGLLVSASLTGLIIRFVDAPEWSTSLATMMGIGIGIDYVLLMVTRFREWRAAGLDPEAATVATLDTAGRSVVVAGSTVVISLLGLFAMGISYMRGAALVTIAGVLVVLLASTTLFPALLGYLGRHVERLRLPIGRRRPVAVTADGHVNPSKFWLRWSRLVERHRYVAALAGVAALIAFAIPFFNVQFGFPDAGNNRTETTTRQAYDLISDGFGPGANGPLLIAVESGNQAELQKVRSAVASTPGVAQVSPPQLNQAGDTAVLNVIPTTGPQAAETDDLVHRLRDETVRGNRRVRSGRRSRSDFDRQYCGPGRPDPVPDRWSGAVVDAPAAGRIPQCGGGGQGSGDEPAVGGRFVRNGCPGPPRWLGRASGRHRHPDPVAAVRSGADVRGAVRLVDGLRGVPGQPDAGGVGPDR